MNTIIRLILSLLILFIGACKKDSDDGSTPSTKENYASMDDFIKRNLSPLQVYTISANQGGSFTTPKGTIVTIPSNAFIKSTGSAVTGNVTIEFKDLLKKSEMVLNNKPTLLKNGQLLVSGGEFFFRAIQEGNTLILATGKKVDVALPVSGSSVDTSMAPLAAIDSLLIGYDASSTQAVPWSYYNANATLVTTASSYIYSFIQFPPPATSGSWFNCDHPLPGSINTASLTLQNTATQAFDNNSNVYFIFKDLNSCVEVPRIGSLQAFRYQYAPCGEKCTAVSFAIKDGELYSSFIPLTISNTSQTVDFSYSKTTTEIFKQQLEALN